jgi:transcriptional antiterminator RfaH
MTVHWYVLRSKPNKEDFLWRQLQADKIETFYPRVRVQVVNPRARKIRLYFPGYLFIKVDLETAGFSTFNWMPGSSGLVTFGGSPPEVPDGLVAVIRKRLDEINTAGGEILNGLKAGDAVIIEEGPFAGYEAIFDARISGNERVRVLLKLLSKQQVPLDLPTGLIRKKKP